MQFLLIAYDSTDEKAQDRRLLARQKHFDYCENLKAAGHMITGTAILNESGKLK